ncbi:MAG: hypothetical protein JOZ99_09155 [Actinobacteria bacterium]|nr:hypothetical protein [Actinomycetota bacterium]
MSAVVVFVAGSVALGACGSSTRSASAPHPRSSGVRTITLHAVEHDLSIKASGNVVTIVNDLLSDGHKIGEGQVECLLSGRADTGLCLGAAVLPDGQILNQARLPVPPPIGTSVDAIVGGTGAYATARGTIDLTRTSLTGDTNVTFHVVLDSTRDR